MLKQVLLVDDDDALLHMLGSILRNAGYSVKFASNLQQAIMVVNRHVPDAVILDVQLGDSESGLSLLGVWKTQHNFPVMVLSSRGAPADRIVGLELGAIDYMSKPFEPRELLLRLKLIIERQSATSNLDINFKKWNVGNLIFDNHQRTLQFEETLIKLTQFETNLLELFVKRANLNITREQILNTVQTRESFANDRTVDVLVGRLRKKLVSSSATIQSVRGIGYRLSGNVTAS